MGYDPADVTAGPPTTITTTTPEVDALIQNAGADGYIGQQIWSLDGDGESLAQSVTAGTTATYHIQAQNNAPYSDLLALNMGLMPSL